MLLACHKKRYLICDEIETRCNIYLFQAVVSALFLAFSVLYFEKKIGIGEYSKIRNFVTYQTTFLMTCQQH